MTSRQAISDVASTAQQWLNSRRDIESLEYRAQIAASEAAALEAEADKDRKDRIKQAKRSDEVLNDLRATEKRIKESEEIKDANAKLSDLKDRTGLNETIDARKTRENEIVENVSSDDHILDLLQRAEAKRQEADALRAQAEARMETAIREGEEIIESVAKLGQLPLF